MHSRDVPVCHVSWSICKLLANLDWETIVHYHLIT